MMPRQGKQSPLLKVFEYGERVPSVALSALITTMLRQEPNVSNQVLGIGIALGELAKNYPRPNELLDMVRQIAIEFSELEKGDTDGKRN